MLFLYKLRLILPHPTGPYVNVLCDILAVISIASRLLIKNIGRRVPLTPFITTKLVGVPDSDTVRDDTAKPCTRKRNIQVTQRPYIAATGSWYMLTISTNFKMFYCICNVRPAIPLHIWQPLPSIRSYENPSPMQHVLASATLASTMGVPVQSVLAKQSMPGPPPELADVYKEGKEFGCIRVWPLKS